MATTPTLEALADGRYLAEPPMKKRGTEPGFTLNSRYLLIHAFFNVLKEPLPKKRSSSELPSVDAEALERMSTPFAARLSKWRSKGKTLASMKNADKCVVPQQLFSPDTPSETQKAIVVFQTLGFDNIERIFSHPKTSVPLNVDKRVRNAFILPTEPTEKESLTPLSLDILNQLSKFN